MEIARVILDIQIVISISEFYFLSVFLLLQIYCLQCHDSPPLIEENSLLDLF